MQDEHQRMMPARSRRRSFYKLRPWPVLVSIMVFGCANARTHGASSSIHNVPGAETRGDSRIKSFDALLGRDSMLHVVWTVREETGSNDWAATASYSAWYQRGHPESDTWDEKVCICRGDAGVPRIVEVGRQLHIVLGGRLRDFASLSNGASWSELPPLIEVSPQVPRFARQFDAEADDSVLRVAYIKDRLPPATPDDAQPDSCDLFLTSREPSLRQHTQLVGTLTGLASPLTFPAMRRSGDTVQVAIGIRSVKSEATRDAGDTVVRRRKPVGQVALFTHLGPDNARSRATLLPQPPKGGDWLPVDQVQWCGEPARAQLLMDSRGWVHTTPVDSRGFQGTSAIDSITVQLMDSEHSQAVASFLAGARGTILWIAPPSDSRSGALWALVHRRPSRLRAAILVKEDGRLRTENAVDLVSGDQEVVGVRVVASGSRCLGLWSGSTLQPLALGGGRSGYHIWYKSLFN
jgi:hypothetical protein